MWTNQHIEDAIRSTISLEYYIDTFVWMDADAGIIPFTIGKDKGEDFFYQREILWHYIAGENIVILKSRRAGLSWIAAAICAWGINFNPGWNALLVSRTELEAISLLKKVKFILNNMAYKDNDVIYKATQAPWLKSQIVTSSQRMLSVGHTDNNGEVSVLSTVQSLTTTPHSGRGEKSRFVFVDEVQFIENQDQVFGAVLTTGARAGQWMMGSNAGDVGTRFHHLCLRGKTGDNKSYWYREVWPEETGIDQDTIDKAAETMPEDVLKQEWYLTFRQPGNAVFDITHLSACYKPIDLYPEIKQTLEDYRQQVVDSRGAYYYYSGVDSAVGKSHRKSNEKDYNVFTALTMTGIQAYTYHDKKPLSTWAGKIEQEANGQLINKAGKVSLLHKEWPGLATIEENGPGYTVINNYIYPEDGLSNIRTIHMNQPVKSRLIKNLIIAIESHSVVITDEKTYQQLSMYQYGATPDTYEAPLGFNDDAVMALAMAWDALVREGGYSMTFSSGNTLDGLTMKPYDEHHKKLVDLETASVAPAASFRLPVGSRPSYYKTRPFDTRPNLPDGRFLPNKDLSDYVLEKYKNATKHKRG